MRGDGSSEPNELPPGSATAFDSLGSQAAIPYYTVGYFWNGPHTSFSSLLDGVCRGGVLSTTLYMIYRDDLLKQRFLEASFCQHCLLVCIQLLHSRFAILRPDENEIMDGEG